jgi:hypothetical protein
MNIAADTRRDFAPWKVQACRLTGSSLGELPCTYLWRIPALPQQRHSAPDSLRRPNRYLERGFRRTVTQETVVSIGAGSSYYSEAGTAIYMAHKCKLHIFVIGRILQNANCVDSRDIEYRAVSRIRLRLEPFAINRPCQYEEVFFQDSETLPHPFVLYSSSMRVLRSGPQAHS